jgi:hypothetical protein
LHIHFVHDLTNAFSQSSIKSTKIARSLPVGYALNFIFQLFADSSVPCTKTHFVDHFQPAYPSPNIQTVWQRFLLAVTNTLTVIDLGAWRYS